MSSINVNSEDIGARRAMQDLLQDVEKSIDFFEQPNVAPRRPGIDHQRIELPPRLEATDG